MGQCQFRHRIDIVRRDCGATLESSERTRRSQHHQVGPHAIDARRERAFRSALQHGIRPRQARQPGAGCNDRRSQAGLFTGMCFGHPERVFVEAQTRAHDRHPLPGFARIGQRHRQAETIQQLGAQFAFLGIHGSDQHEACGVLLRNAVALDGVHAAGGDIEQRVDQRVGQQVDFIDVQHAMVGARQEARRQAQPPIAEHVLDVQRSHQLLDGGGQRQGDEGRSR